MVKKIISIIVLTLAFLRISSICSAGDVEINKEASVIAYYFRGNFRCASCYKIEQYTKEAINKFFADELKTGELVFKTVNIEEKENNHYVQDYKLYTKAVVLSKLKDGKEIDYKNLEKVWSYLRDKERFYDYIKEETGKFLNNKDRASFNEHTIPQGRDCSTNYFSSL